MFTYTHVYLKSTSAFIIFDRWWMLTYDVWKCCGARSGIVRCLKSPRNFQKLLNKSADARPGTGRCPSGHRPMFYESNCHRWEATWFCRSTYCIYIDILLLKTKKHKYKYIFRLSSWGWWLTCNEQVLLNIFAVLSKCVFHHHHCHSQPQSFLF